MADINLVEAEQESNDFKSCTEIEEKNVHLRAQLQSLIDLLNSNDYLAGDEEAITLTAGGAWGLSNTLLDCRRFMQKVTDLAAAGFKKRKNPEKAVPVAPTRESLKENRVYDRIPKMMLRLRNARTRLAGTADCRVISNNGERYTMAAIGLGRGYFDDTLKEVQDLLTDCFGANGTFSPKITVHDKLALALRPHMETISRAVDELAGIPDIHLDDDNGRDWQEKISAATNKTDMQMILTRASSAKYKLFDVLEGLNDICADPQTEQQPLDLTELQL